MSNEIDIAAEVVKAPAENWLQQQYGVYSLYVIRDRALVSSDGLKPVARRLLYSFYSDGIIPSASHVKSARACSSVMRFHPHGNTSIEATAAGMAQHFTTRVLLTDPHGSVGNEHGDTPASARYLELRLTKAAMELVREVSEGAVPMGRNFDGSEDEPRLLPVRWPEHIINGGSGIAVGYASNMLSHNPDEVINACQKLLRMPNMTVDQLLKIMPGPDLPTGGNLYGVEGVKDYYTTGSGSILIRGSYTVEDLPRGRKRIIFHELPFQVSSEKVMEKIREIQSNGRLKEISVVKNLSDRKHSTRLAIETKAGANHLAVLNILFKSTPLESPYSVNNTILVNNSPVKVSMLDMLNGFLEFRKDCTRNKAKVRINKIDHRLHQLNAILAVLLDIDKAIAIIRKSDTSDDARTRLQKEFKIDEQQADYILSMQLRRLTRQDSVAIKTEKKELDLERKALNKLLSTEEELIAAVDADLAATKKIITSKRRTVISGMTTEEVKEAQKEQNQAARTVEKNLPCVVTRFADGRLLKSSEGFAYTSTSKQLPNSPIVEQLKFKTQDMIVLIGSDGIGRRMPLSYLASNLISKPSDMGVQLPRGVKLVGMARNDTPKSDVGLALATKQGKVKLAKTDFPKGDEFPVFLLDANDKVVDARWIGKTLTGTYFTMISMSGNILVFDATSVRLSGSKAGGVAGMKLKNAKDSVIHFGWVQSLKDPSTFVVSQADLTIKLTPIAEIPPKNKGGMGVAVHNFKKGEDKLVGAYSGANLVACLEGASNTIALPPATKRAARGADFKLKVTFGAFELKAL